MSNTIASNYVDQTLNVMTNSITTSTNQCSTNVTTGQYNIIKGGNSINCNVSVSADIETQVDMSCYASTDVQNNVSNTLAQAAKLQAEAVNQQFGLLTFSEAINVSNSYINLSNNMTTAFYNSCITDITTNQTNVIDCGGSSNMTVDVNFNDTTQLSQDCVFNNSNVVRVSNNIKQSVAAAAKAEIQNYIAGIITAMLGVLVVIGLILFLLLLIFKSSGGKKETTRVEQQSGSGGNEDLLALAALSQPPQAAGVPVAPSISTTPTTPTATSSITYTPSQETINQGKDSINSLGNSFLENPSVSKYTSTPQGQQVTSFLSQAAGEYGDAALKSLFG